MPARRMVPRGDFTGRSNRRVLIVGSMTWGMKRGYQETHGFSQLSHSATPKDQLWCATLAPKECMSSVSPITQRDVARACGVHPSTLCLALKNSPSIPLPTRLRVQAAAEELGYRPNVAARNLALLRGDRQGAGSLPIAWINQESQRNHWRADA